MDDELKTFGGVAEDTTIISANESSGLEADLSYVDPLLKEQKKQVDQMRSTLLTFDHTDLNSAKRAMQNITVMRIYHQVGRIIKFTEMMDMLEDKLYDSMIANMGEMDSADPMTLMTLLKVQSQLQETMIQSQLLIKPYLDMDIELIAPPQELEDNSFGAAILPKASRNAIRNGAQALLTELKKAQPQEDDEEEKPAETPNNSTAENPSEKEETITDDGNNPTASAQ